MASGEVLKLLFNTNVHFSENIPVRPTGPATYAIEHKTRDVLVDGWKWRVRGSTRLPAKDPMFRRALYFYDSQDGIEKGFQRHVYERLDDDDRIVIRYVGEPVCLVPAAHGNSITGRPYVRTKPSVLEQIKQIAAATGGHTGPAKIYKEAVTSAASEDVTACPRDMKQVCYYVILKVKGLYCTFRVY